MMSKIKISAELVDDSYTDPTKDRIEKNIQSLVEMIDENELVLPIFQTDLRWKIEDALNLFNWQLSGPAPVAPVSFNRLTRANHQMLNVTFLDRRPISFEEMSANSDERFNVVDGQQRISTNYMAAVNHADFKTIVLDIKKGQFILKKGKRLDHQIPVGILYNKSDDVFGNFLEENNITEFQLLKLLTQIRTKFFNYKYSINNAKNLDFEQQMDWFNRLNLAGSKLPHVQMKLTNLQVKGIDFYKDYARVFVDKVEQAFGGIFTMKTTEVSTPLAALNAAYQLVNKGMPETNSSPMPSDQKVELIVRSDASDIKNYIRLTLESLDKAIEFISSNNLNTVEGTKPRIDYITYLQGFFVFLGSRPLTPSMADQIIAWVDATEFSNKNNTERRAIYSNLLNICV